MHLIFPDDQIVQRRHRLRYSLPLREKNKGTGIDTRTYTTAKVIGKDGGRAVIARMCLMRYISPVFSLNRRRGRVSVSANLLT